MSILIKGMKMPSECEYCGFCRFYRENGRVWCNATNRMLKQKWENPDWTYLEVERPDWCPLIEVPEHGRLIDERDAYDKIAEEAGEESGNYVDMDIVGRGLENTPTVIPADEEET